MPYKLKRGNAFKKQESELKAQFPRFELAIDGIEAALSANPEAFPVEYVDYRIRCITTGNWPDMPMVNVYYRVHGGTVTLDWLQVHDPDADPNAIAWDD